MNDRRHGSGPLTEKHIPELIRQIKFADDEIKTLTADLTKERERAEKAERERDTAYLDCRAMRAALDSVADNGSERVNLADVNGALRAELVECRAELASACDERDTADAELSECRAELENAVKCYRSFCAKFNAADGARQAAEARAEFGARVVEAARARLECWTRETYDVLVGALRMYDAALAETAQKTSETGTREGPTSEKQTATQTTRAREEVATPSRPAEAPQEPGSPSGDVFARCNYCDAIMLPSEPICYTCRARRNPDASPPTPPATSTPDDAERAARESKA